MAAVPTRDRRRLTPQDLVREPFTLAGFEQPVYDPASQTNVPADPIRMLFTHCYTTATYDSSGQAVDNDGQQSDD
jgi:hypothetical protein